MFPPRKRVDWTAAGIVVLALGVLALRAWFAFGADDDTKAWVLLGLAFVVACAALVYAARSLR